MARLAAVLVALLLSAAASGHAAVFNPTSFTLGNGLEVVVVENHRAPVVSHMIWYRVGSADEAPGESGVAHFLEHLMFKGTKTVPPGEFSKIVARNGGTDNAMTSYDFTAYFQSIAKDKLELVMGLEADRMTNLVLTDAEVLPEREVVREERRSRTENRPSAVLSEQANAAFWLNHPYGKPVIGWMHEIEALSTEKALAFYKLHYAPNNAVVVVAGDVTSDEVRAIAERTYGKIPRGVAVPRARPKEPDHTAAMRIAMESSRVREPEWSRRYLAPSYRVGESKHAYALQVLAELLGGGATSRLHRELVVGRGLANSMGASYDPVAYDLSEFWIYGSPRGGATVEEIERAAEEEVRKLLDSGATEAEVARAKRSLQASAVYARDSLRTAPNVIGRARMSGRSLADVEEWPERIEAVTVEQVNAAARAVFDPTRSLTSTLLPAKGTN